MQVAATLPFLSGGGVMALVQPDISFAQGRALSRPILTDGVA